MKWLIWPKKEENCKGFLLFPWSCLPSHAKQDKKQDKCGTQPPNRRGWSHGTQFKAGWITNICKLLLYTSLFVGMDFLVGLQWEGGSGMKRDLWQTVNELSLCCNKEILWNSLKWSLKNPKPPSCKTQPQACDCETYFHWLTAVISSHLLLSVWPMPPYSLMQVLMNY